MDDQPIFYIICFNLEIVRVKSGIWTSKQKEFFFLISRAPKFIFDIKIDIYVARRVSSSDMYFDIVGKCVHKIHEN